MALLDALPVAPSMLGAFALAVLALAMSPGPDTVLILRYTMSSGQRVGFATVAGVQIGLCVHTALAALGLSRVVASSPLLFRLIALAGALYLGWLGLQAFAGASPAAAVKGGAGAAVGGAKALRDALMTNLLNPKVIVLFLALMPNFVAPERGGGPLQFVTLGIVLIAVNVVWQGGSRSPPNRLAAGSGGPWWCAPSTWPRARFC